MIPQEYLDRNLPNTSLTAAFQLILEMSPDGRKYVALGSGDEVAQFYTFEGDSLRHTADQLWTFDWNGNKTGEYTLARRLKALTPPDADGVMYVVMQDDGDPTIATLRLPD